MKTVIIIIGILCIIYFFFMFMPGYMMFFSVFKRKKGGMLTKESMKGTYYEPFSDRILDAENTIKGLPLEELWLNARDGIKLYGSYFDAKSDKTVIFTHGYKADYIDQMAVPGTVFLKEGYNLLFTCNRGHGKSEGKYTSLGLLESEDIIEWVKLLEKKGCNSIALYGTSMGCVAVSNAISKLSDSCVKVAVMDCGFDSVFNQMKSDCKKWHIPIGLMRPALLLQAKLRLGVDINKSFRDSFKDAKTPAVFIHGKDDESVSFSCGEENYKAYGGPKESIFIDKAAHTVALLVGGEPAEEKLINFVKKYI